MFSSLKENSNGIVVTAAVLLLINQIYSSNKKKKEKIQERKRNYLLGKLNFDRSWNVESKQVVLSLTTSPLRIDKIKQVLDNIHPLTYDVICLNIPQKYKRTGEEYVIPEWMLSYPKLVINRIDTDLGPITKVVPAMERFPDSFIVSIDDDILYRPYFINLLGTVFQHQNRKNAIVALRGTNLSSFWHHLKKKNKFLVEEGLRAFQSLERNKFSKNEVETKNFNYRYVELIEGFGGIMYSPTSYNPKIVQELKTLSSLSKPCFQSDDIVLSACFSMYAVPKVSLCYTKKAQIFDIIKELTHGLGNDALHNVQNHGINYVQALKDIVNFFSSKRQN